MTTRKNLRPYPLAYFMSVLAGQFLLLLVLISFLKFSRGHILVGLALAFGSAVLLSFFLSWVEILEPPAPEEEDSDNRKNRFRNRGRL